MRRRKPRPLDLVELLKKRPGLLVAVNAMEVGQMLSGKVDARLKALAQIKTSALIGCPF